MTWEIRNKKLIERLEAWARYEDSRVGPHKGTSLVAVQEENRDLLREATSALEEREGLREALESDPAVEAAARERLMRDRVEALADGKHIPMWEDLDADEQANRLHASAQDLRAALTALNPSPVEGTG